MSIKLDFPNGGKYIAKDESGEVFIYEDIPIQLKNRWGSSRGGEEYTCLIHLPMPWDKSLHKLIRDRDGFVVDLEPYTPDPRGELKVDDKVWVFWNESKEGRKYPRYFSSYDKDKCGIRVFSSGRTSFSADGDSVRWEYWEKA